MTTSVKIILGAVFPESNKLTSGINIIYLGFWKTWVEERHVSGRGQEVAFVERVSAEIHVWIVLRWAVLGIAW